MAGYSSLGRAERHGFYKANPILIIILMIVFIPLSLVNSVCYFQTKQNNQLPTLFSNVVVKANFDITEKGINKNDNLLIKKSSDRVEKGDIVAYFVPSDEQSATGSGVEVDIVQFVSIDGDGNPVYGIKNEHYFVIQEAIIGEYETNASFLITVISFLSSKVALLLLTFIPLGAILILLVLDFIEQRYIKKSNLAIEEFKSRDSQEETEQKNTTKPALNVQPKVAPKPQGKPQSVAQQAPVQPPQPSMQKPQAPVVPRPVAPSAPPRPVPPPPRKADLPPKK